VTFLLAEAIHNLARAQAFSNDPGTRLSFLVAAEEILKGEIREARERLKREPVIIGPEFGEHEGLIADTANALSGSRDNRRSA
jgi:hypothetical protein